MGKSVARIRHFKAMKNFSKTDLHTNLKIEHLFTSLYNFSQANIRRASAVSASRIRRRLPEAVN
jgi:hypothetical protein